MKTNKILFSVSVLAIILCAIYSCEIQEDYEYQPSGSTGKLGVTAWEYIQTKESLSLLEEAIKISGLEDVYQAADTHTFIAPANMIVLSGAKPVLVDVDLKTLTIDPNLIEEKIGKNFDMSGGG